MAQWLKKKIKKEIHLPMQERWVQSLGQEDPLEKEMATHSSILAWAVQWTGEPGWLQTMGHKKVRHDLASKPKPAKPSVSPILFMT